MILQFLNFHRENAVKSSLPNRASFFLSSSVSSVIVSAPSDIFLAVWNTQQIDQMFFRQNQPQNHSSLFLHHNRLALVVKTTKQNRVYACANASNN